MIIDAMVETMQSIHSSSSRIREIVGSARRVNQLLEAIATGADEQASGVAQTAQAVQQLDAMTQRNAALVELTAASAASLKQQAVELSRKVANFKLPQGAQPLAIGPG